MAEFSSFFYNIIILLLKLKYVYFGLVIHINPLHHLETLNNTKRI